MMNDRLIIYPRATGRGEAEIVVARDHDCILHVLTPDQAVWFATSLLNVAQEEMHLARSVVGLIQPLDQVID